MNVLAFLLSLALLSVGFAGGMAFASLFNATQIKELKAENRKLRHDYVLMKRAKKDTVEVIYSRGFDGETTVDCPDNYPDFSKYW